MKAAGGSDTSHKETQFLDTKFLHINGSSSLNTISFSPQIDLYLIKVSYISSHLANWNRSLSHRAKLEEEDLGFLLALVLNFLSTLGAMTKNQK